MSQIRIIEHRIQGDARPRLDHLVVTLAGLTRSRVRGLFAHGGVRVNGNSCEDPGLLLSHEDSVTITFDPERRYKEPPPVRESRGFEAVYTDDHLIVVNKDAGILSVPTDRRENDTLIDRISSYLASGRSDRRRVSVIHRLDRETSGLLVFARSSRIADAIIAQFSARKPERVYAAVVAGSVEKNNGTLRDHLSTDKSLTQKTGSVGVLAITHYEVVTRHFDATLLSVRLETGKRNQIRAQVAALGHPVLGDTRYRPDLARHQKWTDPRSIALHARVLGFRHPVTQEDMKFERSPPKTFAPFL